MWNYYSYLIFFMLNKVPVSYMLLHRSVLAYLSVLMDYFGHIANLTVSVKCRLMLFTRIMRPVPHAV